MYTAVTRNAFQWAGNPKNCPFPRVIWTLIETWLLRPTQVAPALLPNGILISSAFFAGNIHVTLQLAACVLCMRYGLIIRLYFI